MTNKQKLATRQLEIQKRNVELSGVDELTDEQRGELDTLRLEYGDVCSKLIAAGTQPEPTIETRGEDSESVELRALLHDASEGRILAAVHSRKNTDGREAEVQAHFKVGGNEIPHAMLEVRAQTQAPTNVATQQAEILQPIFGQTGAAHLNIPMPTVQSGAATYPVVASRPTPETPAEGATVTADIPAGSFTADLLKPQAAQAQIEFSREDAASFPSMSDALGRVIVDAVGFELDRQMLVHTTAGLLTAGLTAPANPAALADFAAVPVGDQQPSQRPGSWRGKRLPDLGWREDLRAQRYRLQNDRQRIVGARLAHGEVGRRKGAYRSPGYRGQAAGRGDREGARAAARGYACVVVSPVGDGRSDEAPEAAHRPDGDPVVRLQGASC